MRGLWWRATGWRHDLIWTFVAAASLSLGILSALTAYGVYGVRADTDAARMIVVEEGKVTPRTTGVFLAYDDLPGQGQFSVVTFYPGGPDAPMPPGLPDDLRPGDVALSPSLLNEPASEGLKTRYGRLAGTISEPGLGSPDENLAYVVGRGAPPTRFVVSRFGAAGVSPWQVAVSSAVFGESTTIMALPAVLAGVLGLVSVPAASLAWACSRRGADRRHHRDRVLQVLGAPPKTRLALRLGRALPGALLGSSLTTLLVWSWLRRSPTLPFVEFTISGSALSLPVAGAGATLALMGCLALFATPARARPQRSAVSRRAADLDPTLVLVGPLAVAAAAWVPDRLSGGNALVYSLLTWGLAAASLPAIAVSAAVATAMLGGGLRRLGHRRASATLLLSGTALRAATRHTAVLTFALAALTGIAFQATQVALRTQSASVDAKRLDSTIGRTSALVELPQQAAARRWLSNLPARSGAVLVTTQGLTGTCADLAALDIPCDASPPRSARGKATLTALGFGEQATVVRLRSPEARAARYIVVSRDGAPVDLPALKEATYSATGRVTPVGAVAGGWLVASEASEHQSRWVVLWSVAGLVLGVLALLIASSGAMNDHSRRLAPVIALFGPRRGRIAAVVALTTGIPFLIGGLVSIGAHTLEAMAFLGRINRPGALNPLATSLTAVIVAGSLLAVVIAARRILREADDWTAGRPPSSG